MDHITRNALAAIVIITVLDESLPPNRYLWKRLDCLSAMPSKRHWNFKVVEERKTYLGSISGSKANAGTCS